MEGDYVRLWEDAQEPYPIEQSSSPPYTPEHKSIDESVLPTMIEAARAMLIKADIPNYLWPFALKQVMFVRNRVKNSTTGTSPYPLFPETTPSFKSL